MTGSPPSALRPGVPIHEMTRGTTGGGPTGEVSPVSVLVSVGEFNEAVAMDSLQNDECNTREKHLPKVVVGAKSRL